ncbi:hypothetical protein ACVXZ0_12710 [Staphylococcus aureus]
MKFLSIGLDAAVALGHPAVISTALILVPITVLLAVIYQETKYYLLSSSQLYHLLSRLLLVQQEETLFILSLWVRL